MNLDLRALDDFTDQPVTPGLAVQVIRYADSLSPADRLMLAQDIDRTCVYVRFGPSWGFPGIQVALMEGTSCPMKDWHDLANEIRMGHL